MIRNLTRSTLRINNHIIKRYAGHSKWANIRHVKEANDKERGLIFGKLSRQIKVAVLEGGSIDPKANPQLQQVIDQCKRFSMPQATLQNILKNCQSDKSNAKSYTVELKGPGGCFILLEVLTPKLHTFKQQLVPLLKKHQTKLNDTNSGMYLFEEKGIIEAENNQLVNKSKEEQLEAAVGHAIESNAEEVTLEDNVFEFFCTSSAFPQTQKSLENLGYTILNASVELVPTRTQTVGATDYTIYEKLIKKLEELPEIVRIFDNVAVE